MENLSEEIKSLLTANDTQHFLDVARSYILLIENGEIKKQEFHLQIHKKLTELYNAGLSLKPVELFYSNAETYFDGIDKSELKTQNIKLISLFGEDSYYWEIFDPTDEKDKESTQGWLVDDVVDIYADLKIELHKIDEIATDEAVEDGLWQLKFGFTTHWGNHCVNAIRALHYLYYEGKTTI
ncbi:DUF5063 domain-containing protein [Salinimicrobium flavum]|uniref:DUF5063 domain-containing protein n=1 Tax=Salinimicrobium flavum TaxID=1737065 RepID=A0ABW5IVN3_9FLAO